MILFKHGTYSFVLPFNEKAQNGVVGTSTGGNEISSLLAAGRNVKGEIFNVTGGDALFDEAVANNEVIITITGDSGEIYEVPESAISNLSNDLVNYNTGYVTIKVGLLPVDYDYTTIKQQLARNISDVTGVEVSTDEVVVSLSDEVESLSTEDSLLETARRSAAIVNRVSDYGLLQKEIKKNEILSMKLRDAEEILNQIEQA